MIVTKPQFDENELGEGTPVQLCISSKKRKTVKQIGTALQLALRL